MSSDESTPRCPVCGAPGERGVLYGYTSLRLKWLAAHRPLFLGAFALGATPVGQSGWRFPSGRARACGLSCDKCGKIFLDMEARATERQLMTLVRHPLLMAAIHQYLALGRQYLRLQGGLTLRLLYRGYILITPFRDASVSSSFASALSLWRLSRIPR